MKVGILGDVHFGCRSRNRTIAAAQRDFFTRIFIPALESRGITQVIQLGDFLDSRTSVDFLVMKAVNEVLDELEGKGIDVIALLGNHDIYYRHDVQASGLMELVRGRRMFRTVSQPESFTLDGMDFTLVPWICRDNSEAIMRHLEGKSGHLFGHLEIEGFMTAPCWVSKESHLPSEVLSRFDHVWSGHYHLTSRRGNITYVGSACQTTWNDYGDRKRFFILDTSTDETEEIQTNQQLFWKTSWPGGIDISDASGFLRIDVPKGKSDDAGFRAFLDEIRGSGRFGSVTVTVEPGIQDDIQPTDATDSVFDTVMKYIDDCETSLDRARLKTRVERLWKEASSRRKDTE